MLINPNKSNSVSNSSGFQLGIDPINSGSTKDSNLDAINKKDSIFPNRDKTSKDEVDSKGKPIKVSAESLGNRLIQNSIDQLTGKTTKKGINEKLLEKFYSAMESETGKPLTDERKTSVRNFLTSLAENRPADINADQKHDFSDLKDVWRRGKFEPLSWSHVPGGPTEPNFRQLGVA